MTKNIESHQKGTKKNKVVGPPTPTNSNNVSPPKNALLQPSNAQPKKSKKGCCIVIAVVVFLLIATQGMAAFRFGFLSLLGTGRDYSFIPSFNNNNNGNNSSTIPTNGNLGLNDTDRKTNSNKNSSSSPSDSTPSDPLPVGGTPGPVISEPAPGPDSSPNDGSTPQTTFTKQEQIDFFVQVAMKNDQNGYATIPIQKWRLAAGTTAKIRYYNNPTASNIACADATISQINSLSNTIHFSKTTGNDYNIRVFFVPQSEIGTGYGGYYNLSTDADHYVTGGNAYVPSDTYNEADRCHYIRHEMTHVMTGLVFNGLKNHGGYDFSIFNVTAGRSDFLEIDKYAIKIMLNTGVGLGWNESQVRSYLANVSW